MTAEAAPKTKVMTEYVVIREEAADAGNRPLFGIVGTFKAASANEAIKKAAGDKAGTYLAVPARSFKPVKVTVHTETTIRLG